MRDALDRHLWPMVMVALAGLFVISGIVYDYSVREWSSALGLFCLVGVLWRAISSLDDMTDLARALTTAVGLLLFSGFVGQWLLAREIEAASGTTVTNDVGVTLAIASRLFIVLLIIYWPRWLNNWGWPFDRRRA